MDIFVNRFSTFPALRRFAVPALLGMLGTVFALPAGAAPIGIGITSYQLSGTIGGDGGTIYDAGTFNPTTDTVSVLPDPFPVAVPFTLSFDLDDSVPRTPAGGTTSSNFASAISNLDLTIDGMSGFYSSSVEDVDEFDNGSNNQWSIFGFGGSFSTDSAGLDVVDDLGDYVDFIQLSSMDLFLLDMDATLFSQSPPELVAFAGDEFEYADIELTWFTDPGGLYDYRVVGTIDNIIVSGVPVPAAVWLFGSGLLGLAGIARRRKAA